MEHMKQDISRLQYEFKECQKLFTALGDETRQYLLRVLLNCDCQGSRVIELAEKTHLSRPAISHHMQILKDGTCIYYYLDPDKQKIGQMEHLFSEIKRIAGQAPDRSGTDRL